MSPDDLHIALLLGNVRKVVRCNHDRVIHLGRKRRLFTDAHTVGWATARGRALTQSISG